MLEALVSCKGLPEDEYAVTFSAPKDVKAHPEHLPSVLAHIRGRDTAAIKLGVDTAGMLLFALCESDPLKKARLRRTIGFDVIKAREAKREWQAKGDRTLFEGLDSALRAAIYWSGIRLPAVRADDEGLVRIQVPILVLPRPWYEIPIDGTGNQGYPVPTSLGFTSNLYPVEGGSRAPIPLFTLLLSKERLPQLQKALLELYGLAWEWGTQAYNGS